ncbi:conserved protein of unknown function [Xenorhabdus doucetiae]|uniref:Uncharacterized protein n=1 Tax=Xenorhabdus doucetiae TaxID=351671 RepID=A0A068QR67_9GAMM|nr:conserved protein of unknown function [Xenorhabdus doucetiae]
MEDAIAEGVFPVSAGINRVFKYFVRNGTCVPRECGDKPGYMFLYRALFRCSP